MRNKLFQLKLLAILAFVSGLESAVPTAAAAEKITVKLMSWGDTTTMAKYAILERSLEMEAQSEPPAGRRAKKYTQRLT